jgi:putative flippase GtrA
MNKIIFAKAQVSAFIGGITDYTIMIICTEYLHIHYTISIVIGGIIGAVVNFSINRYWTFDAKALPAKKQIPKFILVVTGSILLKSSGTFLFTQIFRLNYKISRIIVDLIVSYGFNYVLQKRWVFRKESETKDLSKLHN